MDVGIILQVVVSGLLIGFILGLIAVGLSLIWGVMDILNFSHGDLMMVAMYSSYLFFAAFNIDPIFSLPITVLILFLIGFIIFHFIIRRVIGYPGLVALLVTFGLSIFIRNVVLFTIGPNFRMINESILAGKRITILGMQLSLPQVVSAFVCISVTGLIYFFISKSKFGRALRATALDKDTALLMGINTNRVFALTFAMGTACVGLAGGMLVNFYYVFPEVGFMFGILSFVIVALGGFGNIGGAFLAAIIVGLVENVGGFFVGPEFKYTLVFVLYLIVITIRPKGLFGW